MGFWNENSYRKLAEILNMDIKILMPPSGKLTGVIINALKLWVYGPSELTKINPYYLLISNPFKFAKLFVKLFFRSKVNGKRASNVITVMLTNKIS
jgi:hypothetical protein